MGKRKTREGSVEPKDNEDLRKRVRRLESLIRKGKSERRRHGKQKILVMNNGSIGLT